MIKIVQVGLGPIGRQLTRYILQRKGLKIVEAIDLDNSIAGKDVGEISGVNNVGVSVETNWKNSKFDSDEAVAVIATVSKLDHIIPQIKDAAIRGLHVVTTCEELTHPWKTNPRAAQEIDSICKEMGICCLATGVNPGFLMDYLPAVLSSVCRNITFVKISRIQDASSRRGPFQQKIGAGLTMEEFDMMRENLGHVGLPESAWFVAEALRLKPDEITETMEPIVASEHLKTDYTQIESGMVAGLKQVAGVRINGKLMIELEFVASVGQKNPVDKVIIEGDPGFRSEIPGGVNGDVATAAIVVNAIPSVLKMQPGLKTMLDVPVPSWYGGLD